MSIFNEVERKFHEIEIRPSSTAKKMLLEEYLQDPLFLWVVENALNPYKTCGLSGCVMPDRSHELCLATWEDVIYVVEGLQSRRLTGKAAQAAISAVCERGVPASMLNRIFSQNLGCGVGEALVNSVRKGSIPTFKVALAEKYSDNVGNLTFPMYQSPKYDGLRCIVIVDGAGEVSFKSRDGLEFQALSEYAQNFRDLEAYNRVFDTEVINGDFYTGAGKVKQKKGKADKAMFMVFDTMPLHEFVGRACQFKQWLRLQDLRSILGSETRLLTDPIQYTPHVLVENDEQVKANNESYWARGLEGSILKAFEGEYEFKRSSNWTKIKKSHSFDLRIIGVEEGKGKYVGKMGALVVDHAGVKAKIGTGFSDKQRREFWDNPPIDQIAEILCHEETPDKNLRHGVFVRLRPDKRLEDGPGN